MIYWPINTHRSAANAGSAPWIRGTRVQIEFGSTPNRFSPVDTGNAAIHAEIVPTNAVQPRGYGERPDLQPIVGASGGSAPWIRGTLI